MIVNTRWSLAISCALCLAVTGCSSSNAPEASIQGSKGSGGATATRPPLPSGTLAEGIQQLAVDPSGGGSKDLGPTKVVFRTNHGDIVVDLEVEKSPRTVNNFVENYVDTNFYKGTIFHHVEKGFMIAGGGYREDFTPISTRGDILSEADNGLKNERGTLTMARHPEARNSANSQFWFNLADNPSLDHQGTESEEDFGYCVFGRVVSGLEVLDQIAELPVVEREGFTMLPTDLVVINSVDRVEQ